MSDHSADLLVLETRRLAWHLGVCSFCATREAGAGCNEGEAQVETVLSLGTATHDVRKGWA